MSQVFISYSRKDKAFVSSLHEALEKRDRKTWVDWEGIPPTAEWLEEIFGAIDAAEAFVFVISPDSIASKICGKELQYAVDQNKRLIPLVFRDVDTEKVPASLGELNWIFIREQDPFEPAIDTLIEALDTDLERVKAHTRLLVRAREWSNREHNSLLLRTRDLQEAELEFAGGAELEPRPTPLQLRYITASRKYATKVQRRILASVTTAMLVAITLAIVAWVQRTEALKNEALTQWKTGILYRDELGLSTVAAHWFAKAASSPDSTLADSARLAATQAIRGVSLEERSLPDPMLACAEFPSICEDSGSKGRFGNDTIDFTLNEEEGVAISWHRDFSIKAWRIFVEPSSLTPMDCPDCMHCAPEPPPMMHDGKVSGALFDSGSNRLISWSEDNSMRIWNVCGHAELDRFMHENPILGASLIPKTSIPETSRILTWSTDNNIRVWELGNPLPRIVGSHDDEILGAAYSPPGRVVSWSRDDTVRFWDLGSGTPALSELHEANEVRKVKIVQDGRQIVSLDRDKSVSQWRVDNGTGDTSFERVISIPLPHGSADVLGGRFDEAGEKILTWDEEGIVRLWGKTTGTWLEPEELPAMDLMLSGEEFYFDATQIIGAEFFDKGTQLVSWGEENMLIWDTTDSPRICQGSYFDTETETGDYYDLTAEGAAVSYDQSRIVGWAYDGEVWMCGLQSCPTGYPKEEGAAIVEMACGKIRKLHAHRVRGATFNRESTRVLSWDENGTIIISDIKPASLDFDLHLMAPISDHPISRALFSPNEKQVLASLAGGDVMLCDIPEPDETGMTCRSLSYGTEVYSLQFDREGKHAMGITSLGEIFLIDIGKWEKLPRMSHATDSSKEIEPGVQFDLSGNRILSWSNSGVIGLWDRATGDPVIAGLLHGEGLRKAKFDREGRQVLSWGGEGRGARVWNLDYQGYQSAYMLQQSISLKTGAGMNDAGELEILDGARLPDLRDAISCRADTH